MSEGPAPVAAVVVHHRSLHTLAGTLADVVAAGVPPASLVVVDNSGAGIPAADLEALVPQGATVCRVPNDGYAAAVNAGVAELRRRATTARYLLVSTHEVRIGPGSMARLVRALDADDGLAAVGPVLWTSQGELWSSGGRLTPLLRLPRHVKHRERRETEVADVAWLDGAVVLYRTDAVFAHDMDERYFLYMEEVDYHLTLARAGWRVGICPDARASQDSGGMPAYYAARNARLFQAKWGARGFRTLAAGYVLARAVAKALVGRRPADARAAVQGFLDGRRLRG